MFLAAPEFFNFPLVEWECFILRCQTIPEVLNELDSLSASEFEKVSIFRLHIKTHTGYYASLQPPSGAVEELVTPNDSAHPSPRVDPATGGISSPPW